MPLGLARYAEPFNNGVRGVFVALSRGLHACYSAVPIENATASTNVLMAKSLRSTIQNGGMQGVTDGMTWGVVRRVSVPDSGEDFVQSKGLGIDGHLVSFFVSGQGAAEAC